MRTLLSVLAALVLAAPAAAQPSAADSALVERLIDGFRLEKAEAMMDDVADGMTGQMGAMPPGLGGMMKTMTTIDIDAVADSIRREVYRDFRPDLVRQAVTFLGGDTMDRVMEQTGFGPGRFDMGAMMEAARNPGDRPLADSLRTLRYVRAMMAATQPPEITQMTMDAMLPVLREMLPPEVSAEMDEGALEAAMGMMQSGRDQQVAMMAQMSRVVLEPIDPDVLDQVTAYYESEAGRYASRMAALGTMKVQLPQMLEAMREMSGRSGASPAGPPPAPSDSNVFDVAEVQPELIGGMAALQRRVVYPEEARREGVEGMVVVQFVLDEAGRVTDPVAVRSPDPRLSEAALAAVEGLEFTPGMVDGQPVKVRFAVPINFSLRGSAPDAPAPGDG